MRSIELIKVATEAELLRLKLMVARQIRRVAIAFAAGVFCILALVFAEGCGWELMLQLTSALYASLVLAGVNLLLAVGLILVALRSSPGSSEREAIRVRQKALAASGGSLASLTTFRILGPLLVSRWRRPKRRRA